LSSSLPCLRSDHIAHIADPFFNNKLLLLYSAWPVHLILGVYVLFVLGLGKKFMESRKPFNVKNIILVYNIVQVIYNSIIFGIAVYYLVLHPIHDLRCMETLPFNSPRKNLERWVTYAYFINKILDLLDTVFFVLRKSYKQITLLHVYHHTMMVTSVYWVIRLYGVGGQYYLMGLLNTFVHSIMYLYYFVTALKPDAKKNLWWKKYITIAQLLQFSILLSQSVYILLFNRKCQFPLILQWFQLLQATIMIYMFGKFYIQTYVKPKEHKV
ncbi:hypothetical protein KR222_010102, partial [Zaprionus bogoriensis]